MTAIVTGAAGFLGRALTRALLDGGEQVVGIDRLPLAPVPGLTVLTADLTAGDPMVRAALQSGDKVFHLAGRPGVRDRTAGIARLRHRDNVLAAAAVLDAVPPHVPLVVTSSSSVYGGTTDGRPSHESDPLRPRGGYARSKVRMEGLCARRLAEGGAVTIVRPFTVAGEGQRPDMAFSLWLEAARAGRPLRLLGSPDRTRDITDVRDAVRALIALAEVRARGVVNLGTGTGHSLRRMAEAVAAALGTPVSYVVEPAGADEVTDSLADVRRLVELTGFAPRTDLFDVVARQARSMGAVPDASGVLS
ncbi:Nucleoside-diphosphate-sugar epimerase [Thermomonospora echinospora]|uniref:Nucleoside-diphosphate-sugar epimerase n=1 Tax=Thermomonospora echinospora TaxID=1992 RepID=A0A1H5SV56_9ACTN|nr:NAD(P)-dependent oxidoreductase [Thermomonospora echinospora]SEF54472.1 Nucleoside-diphosphate-sugar epimerase [Thermomonospora echinospora]